MRHEWPIGQEGGGPFASPAAPDDLREPLLPLALEDHVALIKAGHALDAFARKRAVQIVTHGHTPELDLEKPIALLAHEAKARLNALTEIVPMGRMNLPPMNRERCLRYIEICGGILIALHDRCQVDVPEDWERERA